MVLCDNVVRSFHIRYQHVPVLYLYPELSFQGVVDLN